MSLDVRFEATINGETANQGKGGSPAVQRLLVCSLCVVCEDGPEETMPAKHLTLTELWELFQNIESTKNKMLEADQT
jgi:hypothetical protein